MLEKMRSNKVGVADCSAEGYHRVMESKRETFVALNGLRGLAAMSVVYLHANIVCDHPTSLLPSAYLAVDFFFMLSGFVVAHAYEQKLQGKLRFLRFAEVRLIRLYPLYFLGIIMGGSVALATALLPVPKLAELKWLPAEAIAAASLMPFWSPRLPWTFWSFDPPAWSLFCELLVNAAYALFLVKWRSRALLAFAMVFAVATVLVWPFTQDTLLKCVLRVGFPFAMGVVLLRCYRVGWFDALPAMSPILPAVLLVAAFVPAGASARAVAVIDIFVAFPIIIVLGVRSTRLSGLRHLCELAGNVSYPLYILHFPILMAANAFAIKLGGDRQVWCYNASILAIAVAWAADRWWDRPLRLWLTRLAMLRRGLVEAAPAL